MSVRDISCHEDLWDRLSHAEKPILLYGMGNGADKILNVCTRRGIGIADTFASDGFVRGHSFHGKVVLSYSAAKEKYGDFIVLLSFASSLPDVLETIRRIDKEQELYAPDVPVFGDTLFDRAFFLLHRQDLEETESLLADELSRRTLENVIRYKLTGKISYLDTCECAEEETFSLLQTAEIRNYADLGAYNGDTIRKLIPVSPKLCEVTALEPDRRNFRKLTEYAATIADRLTVRACNIGAWSKKDLLSFHASGNRNAGLASSPTGKTSTVETDTLDDILADRSVDFIKYDVEGAEREALMGSRRTIARYSPRLLVSLYHRSEDLYTLPRLVRDMNPSYSFYLRKLRYIPAWDLNLYAIPNTEEVRHVPL